MSHRRASGIEIDRIVDAALRTGLPRFRELLLSGVSLQYRFTLRDYSDPRMQLLSDLIAMNRDGPLIDGSTPLVTWLENAARLTEKRPQQTEFTHLRDRLLSGDSEPPKAVVEPKTEAAVRAITRAMTQGEVDHVAMRRRMDALIDGTHDLATRACALVDRVVLTAHLGEPPSMVLAALHAAVDATEALGDLRLIARLHARAGWIHGHLGDRRSGLAEVAEGRRVAGLLGIDGGDDVVTELDTVAHWLETG